MSADLLVDTTNVQVVAVGYGPSFGIQWGADEVLQAVKAVRTSTKAAAGAA